MLGRNPRNFLQGLPKLHEYLIGFARAFAEFDRPLEVIRAYITRRAPARGSVRLRAGLTIHLSGDPADIVTVFVIFARRDYGRIPAGAIVVDVGANIGVFALYAAACGARRVLAYEPSADSFACLERNIRENHLESTIVAHRLAVASADRTTVRFPRRSSAMNTLLVDACIAESDEVSTTTLDAIVDPVEQVDLVKLDCEGAEYEILFGASAAAFRKIVTLKLEYHRGRREELVARLRGHGFEPVRQVADNAIGGVLWFARPRAA
jgi:FkbM family methyltransferase